MPNLAELRSLKMSWTCLVCRCTDATEPKRKCRVIPRTAEERSLFHASSSHVEELIATARRGRHNTSWPEGTVIQYAEDLAESVLDHFTTASYDDVICEHCDPQLFEKRLRDRADEIADMIDDEFDVGKNAHSEKLRIADVVRERWGARDDR